MLFRITVNGNERVVEAENYKEAIDDFEMALWEAGELPDDDNLTADYCGGSPERLLAENGFLNFGVWGENLPCIEKVDEVSYFVDECITTPDGELLPRGFVITVSEWEATLKVPSDVYGDPTLMYEETVSRGENFAVKYEDGTPVHPDDGELLGELVSED